MNKEQQLAEIDAKRLIIDARTAAAAGRRENGGEAMSDLTSLHYRREIQTLETARRARAYSRMRERLAQIAATYATHTIAEQAALLGISESRVGTLRSEAIKAGLVKPEQRSSKRRWTPREDARLRRLLAANTPLPRIAQVLERTINSVQAYCLASDISIRDMRAQHYTSITTAALFCVSVRTVERWLRDGWLHGERDNTRRARLGTTGGAKSCPAWRISRQAVEQFVQERRAWPAYHPNVVSDPALRQLAQAARNGADGRWIPYTAYLERLGISDTTYRAHKQAGQVPPVEVTNVGRALFMWISNEEAQP